MRVLGSVRGGGKKGAVTRTGKIWFRIGCGLGPRCRGNDRVGRGVSRVAAGSSTIADLRHKGDPGNGQKGGVVRRYFENGAEAGKGWGKRGRGVRRLRGCIRHERGVAEARPRSEVLAGEENAAGGGVVVGDGGRGVRGGTKLWGF